jgi:hypothetical protein
MKKTFKITFNTTNAFDEAILEELGTATISGSHLKRRLYDLLVVKQTPIEQQSTNTSKDCNEKDKPEAGNRYTSEEDKKINEKLKKMAI